MKKILISLLFIAALVTLLTADINKMWITGKAEKTTDIVPAKYQTANRELAACIIILTDLDVDLDFQPNVQYVGKTHDKPGEWCFYIARGERRIDIYAVGYEPLIVILREVGIPVVHSGDVFRLRLTGDKPSVRNIENVNIVVNTNPSNATVYLNDQKVDDPRQILASVGKNVIRVESSGYKPIIEEIEVSEKKTFFEYKLDLSLDVPVAIESEPSGATIFLSNVECGKTPASFFYQEGEYQLKLTFSNQPVVEEKIGIKAPQTTKKYYFEDNRGSLTIKTAQNSKVYINDEHYPQGVNNLKLAPQLAQIRITTPKSTDIVRSVIIKEKEPVELKLFPELDMGTVGISVMPHDSQVELIGDSGERFNSNGSQTFRDIPIGEYQLVVSSGGYKTHKESFTVKKDEVVRKQVALSEGSYSEQEAVHRTKEQTAPKNMVYVPGGTFTMGRAKGSGNNDELPTHNVTHSSFFISKYLVTQGEYESIMYTNPSREYGIGYYYPVYYVSWYDAIKYCNLLSIKEGLTPVYAIKGSTDPKVWGVVPKSHSAVWDAVTCSWTANGYRLPTEAEWEYAARGGTNSPDYLYSGSKNIKIVAWYSGNNSPLGAKPVGEKPPNSLGVYDMSGNLYEWCWDWYNSRYYIDSPRVNPQGPERGNKRVLRGGSWKNNPYACRNTIRYRLSPETKVEYIGFRICRNVE